MRRRDKSLCTLSDCFVELFSVLALSADPDMTAPSGLPVHFLLKIILSLPVQME